jgi:hypothetical protein
MAYKPNLIALAFVQLDEWILLYMKKILTGLTGLT